MMQCAARRAPLTEAALGLGQGGAVLLDAESATLEEGAEEPREPERG